MRCNFDSRNKFHTCLRMGPSLLEQIKNYIEFNIYKNFTSPDANEFVKEKKEKEVAAQPPPPTVEPLEVPVDRINIILTKIYDWALANLPIVFGVIFAILISNEMIVHPAKVRIVFFIFTYIVCVSSFQALYAILIYYLVKLGYYFYKDEDKRDGILPRIFAVCPIWVAFPEEGGIWNSIKRFIAYPFTYLPRDKPEKEKDLKQIMTRYIKQLKDLKPWTKYEGYKTNIEKAELFLDTLHVRTPGTEEKTESVSAAVASIMQSVNPNNIPEAEENESA